MSRFFEDFAAGDVYRSRLGRTVSEADNTWFRLLTMNTNQMHFNRPYAERTEFGQPLVVSTLTLAIVLGLSVADTSENAVANLGWDEIRLPKPVYAGDTLGAELRDRRHPHARAQPARGGRDRVHSQLHGVQADGPRARGRVPGDGRAVDGRRGGR